MIKYKRIATYAVIISFLISISSLGSAIEPSRPIVDRAFDSTKEEKIRDLPDFTLKAAFARLKGVDLLVNKDLLNKAVFAAFKNRRKKAIGFAMDYLKSPVVEIIEGKPVSRGVDFYVAKKILQVFPDEALDSLLKLYSNSNNVTRGNIVRILGKLAGGEVVRNVLIEALDDKSFCEEEYPEMIGEPLRICDIAYNQLVLRYKIKNVLRTIGSAYRIEVREHHIDMLKSRL